jgi:hypothetical protein
VKRRQAALTDDEHAAVRAAGDLWGLLVAVTGDGPSREGDLAELVGHIHAIQNAVLAQAAARAYPDRYRLMGGPPVTERTLNAATVPDMRRAARSSSRSS